MLRACIINFNGNWDEQLLLVEFSNHNSYRSSISMAPYEALFGGKCRSPIGWFQLGKSSLLGPELIYNTLEKVHIKRNQFKTANSRQKFYTDNKRRELEF